MKRLIKKIIPEAALLFYHKLDATRAARLYKNPSERLVVIGITGTKGKTSTANYVWSVLHAAGLKAGLIGTANIRIGDEERMNTYHMTMPNPHIIQKILREMVEKGVTHVVMEMTSEGIKQFRHVGINTDILIFTNLYPEHLPSHGGSFEKYKATKGIIFKELAGHAHKTILGKKVLKTIIANADSEHATYYLGSPADTHLTFSLEKLSDIKAEIITTTATGLTFKSGNDLFELSIPGIFNVYNALGAIAVGRALELPHDAIKKGLSLLTLIPGRMEVIDEGQSFTVFVDYAHEKQSMGLLMKTARSMVANTDKKVIVLLGAEGGGRDKAKRPAMGEIVGQTADYVVVSNVDPYDDDPKEIIEDIATVVETRGKVRDITLFTIEDRREGITKALSLASSGDIVLITGKGSEQSMIIADQKIPWDDRAVVRESLKKLTTPR